MAHFSSLLLVIVVVDTFLCVNKYMPENAVEKCCVKKY